MKITIGLAKKLQKLLTGKKLPGSQLKAKIVEKMLQDEVLAKQFIGSRKSLIFIPNREQFIQYLINNGISNLDNYIASLENSSPSRSELIKSSSDSKTKTTRTFKGFLVNCLNPINCKINGQETTLNPTDGLFTFIYDYEQFLIPTDITIIGVENAENFRFMEEQQYLFQGIKQLFVSRYPQSKDLIKWLQSIPNNYLHFGDFDFAGINIYINEFQKYLGKRAQFFIPDNIEWLLEKYGNRKLFDKQYNKQPNLTQIPDDAIIVLLELFHRYRKLLEQEVLIREVG